METSQIKEAVLQNRLMEEIQRSTNLQIELETVYQELQQYKADNAEIEQSSSN